MAANENEATAPPASNKSLLGRLIIAAFMGGIVLTECALAYVFIPSADDLVQRAEENAKEEMKKDSDEAVAAKDTKPVVEIELDGDVVMARLLDRIDRQTIRASVSRRYCTSSAVL